LTSSPTFLSVTFYWGSKFSTRNKSSSHIISLHDFVHYPMDTSFFSWLYVSTLSSSLHRWKELDNHPSNIPSYNGYHSHVLDTSFSFYSKMHHVKGKRFSISLYWWTLTPPHACSNVQWGNSYPHDNPFIWWSRVNTIISRACMNYMNCFSYPSNQR